MFSFMKKDKDKDKDKKEKGEKKKKEKDERGAKKEKEKKERQYMTPEEMSRIEEMKKGHGVFRRFSEKDKNRRTPERGSPDMEEGSSGSSRGSPVKERPSLTRPHSLRQQGSLKGSPPPTAPKPKARSILKGKTEVRSVSPNLLDDSKLLQDNTKHNEDMLTSNIPQNGKAGHDLRQSHGGTFITGEIPQVTVDENADKYANDSSKLKLPPLVAPPAPNIREIVVKRTPAGDFGFSLRKGLTSRRGGNPPKIVIFAEPGSGSTNFDTGLLPGDRLVEVCNVKNIYFKFKFHMMK